MVGWRSACSTANLVGRAWAVPITGSLLAALSGGLAFFLAFDVTWLNEWQFWAAVVGGMGRCSRCCADPSGL